MAMLFDRDNNICRLSVFETSTIKPTLNIGVIFCSIQPFMAVHLKSSSTFLYMSYNVSSVISIFYPPSQYNFTFFRPNQTKKITFQTSRYVFLWNRKHFFFSDLHRHNDITFDFQLTKIKSSKKRKSMKVVQTQAQSRAIPVKSPHAGCHRATNERILQKWRRPSGIY
jgi:hypothetical protein